MHHTGDIEVFCHNYAAYARAPAGNRPKIRCTAPTRHATIMNIIPESREAHDQFRGVIFGHIGRTCRAINIADGHF